MEVGLVCVFSPDPHVRAHVDDMARQLVPIEHAKQEGFDELLIALRARIVPWVNHPVVHDPATKSRLILLGRAWLDNRDIRAEALLQNYLRDGEIALTHLGGSFAILLWQPFAETLHVVTDRLGTKKIYAWRTAESTLLATELRALLGHPQVPRVIDEVAVGQFLITSHLVDNRSLISNVNVLPPGTITRIDRSGVSTHFYWRPRIAPALDDGLDAWADRLASVLSPAVQARCGDTPPLLPLSGGLDSRSVAAFIPPNLASAATACSFGHPHCYDVRYGRRVAHVLGATFTRLPVPDDFFRRYLKPVLAMCDGEVSIEALPIYRLIEMGRPGQTMLMGFLGDALSGGHLLGLERTQNTKDALNVIWRKRYQGQGFSEQLLECVLLPERYQAIKGHTRTLLQFALNNADAPTLDEKALVVELHHRQSRYISYFGRLLSSRYHVENPLLDLDVLDTFLAMPLAHRKGQRAYRRMLVRHAPRLAAVPENKTHRPVTYADRHGMFDAPKIIGTASHLPAGVQWRINNAQQMLGDLLVTVSEGWLGPHNRDYYVHHEESIRRIDPEWFQNRLLNNPLAADWFHVPTLEKLVEEHMARKQDHSVRINNVVAFLEWRGTLGA
ncbi:MAG: asparagine synthase-related protein [Gallionella sp.]